MATMTPLEPRKFLKRRGRKGEAQAELWAALVPIVEKYWGAWPELETLAFLSLEAEAAINTTATKMQEQRKGGRPR